MTKTVRQTLHLFCSPSHAAKTFLLLGAIYFFLLWSRQYYLTPSGLMAGWIGSWADGAVHLTYASTFAYGPGASQGLPLFSGHPFTYSFAADLITGLLAKTGIPVYFAHSLLGFLLSCFLLITLYRFYLLLFRQPSVAILATIIFFCSGGLGFVWFFQDLINQGPSIIFHLPTQYTHLPTHHLEWINTITGLLVPQRSLLLALPLGLLTLMFYWKLYTQPQSITKPHLFSVGLLLGFMPIIHPHTLLVLITTGLFTVLISPQFPKTKLIWLLAPAVTISLPLITLFLLPATGDGFTRFYPGWLAKSKSINWLYFWFLNWGLLLPLFTLALLRLSAKLKLFLLPFIFLFFLSNLFLFQPYDWDNVKILVWAHLAFSGPTAQLLINFFRHNLPSRLISVTLAIILCLSGALDIIKVLDLTQNQLAMFTREELQLASFIRDNTPPHAIFLTSSRHNHPVPTLTGRQILMGYPGWLWTYGINYRQREQEVSQIYSASPQADQLIDQYSISYIVIGPSETQNLHPNQTYFDQNFPIFTQTANYTVYSTNR